MHPILVLAVSPHPGRTLRLLRRAFPEVSLEVLHDPEVLLEAARVQFPSLIIVLGHEATDARVLCHRLQEVTNAPVLVVGPWDVVGHLDAGADICLPHNAPPSTIRAYATALRRRWRPPTTYVSAALCAALRTYTPVTGRPAPVWRRSGRRQKLASCLAAAAGAGVLWALVWPHGAGKRVQLREMRAGPSPPGLYPQER